MNIKKDFPIFNTHPDLVYLDNAATSQKPQQVLDAVNAFYTAKNANIHRGIYSLSEDATQEYEGAREKVREFINARSSREIIFTSGTTESINLVAQSLSKDTRYKIQDTRKFQKTIPNTRDKQQITVLVSVAEHHSNVVPYQITGYTLRFTGYDSDYRLDAEEFKRKLETENIDLVSIVHVSNVLGTINPIKKIVQLAHDSGAKVLVDGAQAIPHIPVDVQELDADFYAFSGHKMFGPTGVGVLYTKEEILETMEPHQGGGGMIKSVSFEKLEYSDLPWKFEAGTPNIAGVIGLGAAIGYMQKIGFEYIIKHEKELSNYTLEQLNNIKNLTIYGPSTLENRLGVFSFSIDGIHAHDLASILDEQNIAIRAGHHCCMPLHERIIKKPATARVSLSVYNSKEDIDRLVMGIERAKRILCLFIKKKS